MASETLTSSEYIRHHLQNLTYGQNPDTGIWEFASTSEAAKDMGFMAFHVDTLGVSFVLGALFLSLFYRVGKRMTADTPSGMQNFVESIIDFINENVRGSFSGKNPMVAPLALTVFIWIVLMNTMDLVPVGYRTSPNKLVHFLVQILIMYFLKWFQPLIQMPLLAWPSVFLY